MMRAGSIISSTQPHGISSKGAFVSVPVRAAARLRRGPTIIHESDLTPGLANRLAAPFAEQMLTTFPETVYYVKKKNVRYVGPIIREELLRGIKLISERLTKFPDEKPGLLIVRGSSG